MLTPVIIVLILNSLTFFVVLGLLLLLLWHRFRRPANLYFAMFLLMMLSWSAGSLLSQIALLLDQESSHIEAGIHLIEFGFVGSSLTLSLYVLALVGVPVYYGGAAAVIFLLAYHGILLTTETYPDYSITSSDLLHYHMPLPSYLIYIAFDLGILGSVWQNFRKIQRPALVFGIMLFCLGQLTVSISPRLRVLGIAEDTTSLAVLVMTFALIRYQVILPLAGQTRQIEVARDVGLAVTSRLRLQNVLETIATQAAILLRADASLIFLKPEDVDELVLAAQYNIHENLLGHRVRTSEGLAGKVASERHPTHVVDYRRDWAGEPDTPFAKQGFGSVIGVPLLFSTEVVGVLLVINGVDNRIFETEDVHLLELLAPQAAVAITNSRLFEQERALTSKLEAAITQMEAFLLSTDNPVIALDKKLRVIFANKAATELIGQDSFRNQSLLNLVPASYLPPQPRQLIQDLRARRSHVYELKIEERIFMCHLARVEQPQRGWVAVLNDVTSLKELDRLQRQMIELTTHQLKNPLQAAMLHLDELEDLGEDVLTEDMRYDLSVIWDQLERMQRLVASILNLERLQSRSVRATEQVDFSQVTLSAVSALRRQAEAKHIQLEVKIGDNLPLVRGDPSELTEAVTNLVDNAIKYTPPQGQVQVEAWGVDGSILLRVNDTGIGIAESEHERIFDRFYRIEQPGTEQISGTGMGLSLVKAIIERHHGRVWLESEPNAGTTFYVSLPGLK